MCLFPCVCPSACVRAHAEHRCTSSSRRAGAADCGGKQRTLPSVVMKLSAVSSAVSEGEWEAAPRL